MSLTTDTTNIIKCNSCGAIYKGEISKWTKFVKCEYCGAVIFVSQSSGAVTPLSRNDIHTAEINIKKVDFYMQQHRAREFSLSEFEKFLRKKGIKTFDPISGVLMIGSQEILINENGVISGPEKFKKMVEKWIEEYMSQ